MDNLEFKTNDSWSGKANIAKKSKILRIFLVFFILVSSVFTWMISADLIRQNDLSGWYYLTLAFSCLFICIQLGAVIIRKKWLLEIIILISYSLSLIFVRDIFHFFFVLVSALFVYLAIYSIRAEVDSRIKLNMRKSFSKGKRFIVISLALIVASNYYLFNVNVKDYAQRLLDAVEGHWESGIKEVLPFIVKDVPDAGNMTVDEFIEYQSQGIFLKNLSTGNQLFLPEIESQEGAQEMFLREDILKNFDNSIIEQGRGDLSGYVGRDVGGDEKISKVLAEIVNSRIKIFLSPLFRDSTMFVLLSSSILFLALLSAGLFFATFMVIISAIIFKLFVALKIVKIDVAQKNVEIIV